jgi:hypothetical protein
VQTLTPKQSSFVQHVANGCSYTQAYREAYATHGKVETLRTDASRLARLPHIAVAIETRKRKARARREHASLEGLFRQFHYGKASVQMKAAVQLGKSVGLF